MTDDGPIIGVFLETQSGGRVNVRVVGADEVPLQSEIANAHIRLLVDEAVKAGVRPPAWFIFGSAQIFYKRGRPVEARMSGATRKVAHYTDDGQPVWLFPPWSTDSAPHWSDDGGMTPEDAGRTYQAARSQAVEQSGELQPVLRRWWNLHEHSPRSFVFWRDLADLAESEADFPLAAQGVARAVLEKMRDRPPGTAAYALSEAGASWQHKLVKGIKARLIELRQVAGMDGEAPPADDAGAEVTRKASAWLAEMFPKDGAESAEELRRRAMPEPWAPWWPEDDQNFAFVLRVLALLVWRNEVEAEAERARRNRPGLVRKVYADQLVAVQTNQLPLPGLESRELRDRSGRIVATIDGTVADLALVHDGLEALRAPMGNRLMKDLVLTAHRQYEVGEALYNVVRYEGGWSGLAEAVLHSGRDLRDLKALATMGQHVQWQSRDGIHQGGGWWTWSAKRGGPGASGFVRFTLADCLLPGFAAAMKQDDGHALSARQARRLVPELPYEPPTGAVNERSQGAVWSLHRLFLVELVDRAEELARNGLVVVKDERWREMAKLAELPISLLPKVLASWTEGESDKAPKMVERDGHGWRLALDVYGPEHGFLVEAGQRRIDGRKGGQKK